MIVVNVLRGYSEAFNSSLGALFGSSSKIDIIPLKQELSNREAENQKSTDHEATDPKAMESDDPDVQMGRDVGKLVERTCTSRILHVLQTLNILFDAILDIGSPFIDSRNYKRHSLKASK